MRINCARNKKKLKKNCTAVKNSAALAGWALQEKQKMLFVIRVLTEDAYMCTAGTPTMNFIKSPKKQSGQNRTSWNGSYAYVLLCGESCVSVISLLLSMAGMVTLVCGSCWVNEQCWFCSACWCP